MTPKLFVLSVIFFSNLAQSSYVPSWERNENYVPNPTEKARMIDDVAMATGSVAGYIKFCVARGYITEKQGFKKNQDYADWQAGRIGLTTKQITDSNEWLAGYKAASDIMKSSSLSFVVNTCDAYK